MPLSYEATSLWKNSLGRTEHPEHCEKLRAAFGTFRERTRHLLETIATALPNLTVHDVTHIDALWETASLIAGEHYPINPMEGFVLGGAMLLHDSALCFEAYDQGRVGLRSTTIWQDAFATEQKINNEREEPSSTEQLELAADFTALRLLHAKQAEKLVERFWKSPTDDTELFLLDNQDLRKRYGPIIGQIAASHAWNIEDVSSRLPQQINSPGDWPAEWRIDPVKLACILRTADASHIDNRRAPDFLYALVRRQGLSLQHWKAQNWLARADLDQADLSHETLLFTSNKNFKPEDAEAWWVAYDAICLVDKEISSSNALLSSRPQKNISPEFAVRRVAGASSPDTMSTYVRCEGWKPWHAELHVGNVQRLVQNLGGKNIYGEDPAEHFGIVIRELLQNARDAISAKREMDNTFDGKIRIQIIEDGTSPPIIEISDDGTGMSPRVMMGPLLDFGGSFWRSDLVVEEFPGLQSSKFASIGQFGIGFYSIFMIADAVTVASRRFDRGLDTVCSMLFPNGLTLRPIFQIGNSDILKNASTSTVVRCTLKTKYKSISKPRVKARQPNSPDLEITFADFIARLASGIDVSIDVRSNDGPWITAHTPISKIANDPIARHRWLETSTLAKYWMPAEGLEALKAAAERLRPVTVGKEVVGFACLSLDSENFGCGTTTIGGLQSGGYSNTGGSRTYYGYFDARPNSAKREPGKKIADSVAIETWAAEQIKLLNINNLSLPQLFTLPHTFVDFDIDPSPYLVSVFFNHGQILLLNLDQTIEMMKVTPIAVFKFSMMDHTELYVQQTQYENYPTYRPTGNGNHLTLTRDGDIPKNANSFIGCLYRSALRHGGKLKFENKRHIGTSSMGQPMDVLIISFEST